MSEKRRGLGRGLGALIPSSPNTARAGGERPVDVFFPDRTDEHAQPAATVGATGPGDGGARPDTAAARSDTALLDRVTDGFTGNNTIAPPDSRSEPRTVTGDVNGRPGAGGLVGSGAAGEEDASGDARRDSGDGSHQELDVPPGKSGDFTHLQTAAVDAPAESTRPEPPALAAVRGADTSDSSDPTELVPVPGARFAELPVTSIAPNPRQPRQVFDEEALAELVHSIREVGVLQPIVVRPVSERPGAEPSYELIMGERRLRAAQEAGLDRIPSIIRDTPDDDLLRDALLENLHRSQLNALEEAAAYQQLLDDFGCTHEELASRIGRSRPQISNTIRLLKLPPLVQRRVAAGVLSAGHARALLGLDDNGGMERLAQRIVSEGLSVRAVEEIVALGDGPVPAPPKKRPRPGPHTSELDDFAARLGDRLDTRVALTLGRSRGRLSIDFASVEDLNRIVALMAPDVRGVFQRQ